MSESREINRKSRIELGICTRCGKRPAKEGHTTCQDCLNAATARMTPEKLALRRARNKKSGEKRKDRRNAKGLCARCGERPNRTSKRLCEECSQSSNNHNKTIRLFRKFGLTSEEYQVLLTKQGGCCAICKTTEPSKGKHKKRFSIDHDHAVELESGMIVIRGILCDCCNRALGMFQDSPDILRAALNYLEDNRAKYPRN